MCSPTLIFFCDFIYVSMFYKPLGFLHFIKDYELDNKSTYYIMKLHFTATKMHDEPHMIISEDHALKNTRLRQLNGEKKLLTYMFKLFYLF